MPKYRNDGENDQYLFGCGTVPVGETGSPADGKYITRFGKGDSWTVVENAPAPWKTFHEGTLPVSIASGLANYSQIEIINSSGAAITVIANSDSDNSRIIPDGQFRIIGQDREMDSISITGSGAGWVYVYGTLGG